MKLWIPVAVEEIQLRSSALKMNMGYPIVVGDWKELFVTFTSTGTSIFNSLSVISIFWRKESYSTSFDSLSCFKMYFRADSICLKFSSERPALLNDSLFSASEYSTYLIILRQTSEFENRHTYL